MAVCVQGVFLCVVLAALEATLSSSGGQTQPCELDCSLYPRNCGFTMKFCKKCVAICFSDGQPKQYLKKPCDEHCPGFYAAFRDNLPPHYLYTVEVTTQAESLHSEKVTTQGDSLHSVGATTQAGNVSRTKESQSSRGFRWTVTFLLSCGVLFIVIACFRVVKYHLYPKVKKRIKAAGRTLSRATPHTDSEEAAMVGTGAPGSSHNNAFHCEVRKPLKTHIATAHCLGDVKTSQRRNTNSDSARDAAIFSGRVNEVQLQCLSSQASSISQSVSVARSHHLKRHAKAETKLAGDASRASVSDRISSEIVEDGTHTNMASNATIATGNIRDTQLVSNDSASEVQKTVKSKSPVRDAAVPTDIRGKADDPVAVLKISPAQDAVNTRAVSVHLVMDDNARYQSTGLSETSDVTSASLEDSVLLLHDAHDLSPITARDQAASRDERRSVISRNRGHHSSLAPFSISSIFAIDSGQRSVANVDERRSLLDDEQTLEPSITISSGSTVEYANKSQIMQRSSLNDCDSEIGAQNSGRREDLICTDSSVDSSSETALKTRMPHSNSSKIPSVGGVNGGNTNATASHGPRSLSSLLTQTPDLERVQSSGSLLSCSAHHSRDGASLGSSVHEYSLTSADISIAGQPLSHGRDIANESQRRSLSNGEGDDLTGQKSPPAASGASYPEQWIECHHPPSALGSVRSDYEDAQHEEHSKEGDVPAESGVRPRQQGDTNHDRSTVQSRRQSDPNHDRSTVQSRRQSDPNHGTTAVRARDPYRGNSSCPDINSTSEPDRLPVTLPRHSSIQNSGSTGPSDFCCGSWRVSGVASAESAGPRMPSVNDRDEALEDSLREIIRLDQHPDPWADRNHVDIARHVEGGVCGDNVPLDGIEDMNDRPSLPDDVLLRSYDSDSAVCSVIDPAFNGRPGFNELHHDNNYIYEVLQGIPWVLGYHSQGRSISIYADLDQADADQLHDELCRVTRQPRQKFNVKSHHEYN